MICIYIYTYQPHLHHGWAHPIPHFPAARAHYAARYKVDNGGFYVTSGAGALVTTADQEPLTASGERVHNKVRRRSPAAGRGQGRASTHTATPLRCPPLRRAAYGSLARYSQPGWNALFISPSDY